MRICGHDISERAGGAAPGRPKSMIYQHLRSKNKPKNIDHMLDIGGKLYYNTRMKKATYMLRVVYENGDSSSRGGLTQTKAYAILKRYEENGWQVPYNPATQAVYIKSWEITTGKKEIEF